MPTPGQGSLFSAALKPTKKDIRQVGYFEEAFDNWNYYLNNESDATRLSQIFKRLVLTKLSQEREEA